jgi:hypothetical protein
MQDTVEIQVKGLAEQILAEDEKLRGQELVRVHQHLFFSCYAYAKQINRTYLTSPQNDRTGT